MDADEISRKILGFDVKEKGAESYFILGLLSKIETLEKAYQSAHELRLLLGAAQRKIEALERIEKAAREIVKHSDGDWDELNKGLSQSLDDHDKLKEGAK